MRRQATCIYMKKKQQTNRDEDALIEMMRMRLGTPPRSTVLGIGDDAAVLKPPPPGHEILITTDLLVEGTHFRLEWSSPYQAGWKAMAASVSDIAAMGGRPTCAVVSIGVRPRSRERFIRSMYDGIKAASERYRINVAGGDTVRCDRAVINIALLGEVAAGAAVRRSLAKPGDLVYVTGTCGDSAAGLDILAEKGKKIKAKSERALVEKHLVPEPVPEAGIAAAACGAVTAMMDLSDGIATDLPRLAKSSGCGAVILPGALPVSPDLMRYCRKHEKDPLEFALKGGEDFNLLMAVTPERAGILEAAVEGAGLKATRIGEMLAEKKFLLEADDGEQLPLNIESFRHF